MLRSWARAFMAEAGWYVALFNTRMIKTTRDRAAIFRRRSHFVMALTVAV